MKAYRATGTNCHVTAATPKAAAEKFFNTHPTKRKCTVIEGETDGRFFTVTYGNPWPQSWKDITKNQIDTLPGDTA